MKTPKIFAALGLIGAISVGSIGVVAPIPAAAQDPAYMSCEDLWYARNRIYARNGYCFNTDRARAVFGAGCFPPYGRLSGWEKSRVNQLQMWERRKGC
ncbi:MAG: YARHG domain-containing protein [Alphaproteobacteria bacterium]|nr:YARHG domain-containing protein [Alphaproteobacteria bacterium]MBM3642026.1 YARHG domain-containing protein [Alphaproteobacteria bacterium]